MDGALNIRERIIEDARKEADKVIDDAKKRADKLIEENKLEAQKIREKIVKRDTELGEEQRRRMLSTAHMAIRKKELSVKLELIDEAFDHVLDTVKGMSDEEYDDLIFNMLQGLSLKGDEEIIFPREPGRAPNSSVIEKLNNSLKADGQKGNVQIAADKGDFKFGFIIRSAGVEMNNSLEAILDTIRDGIEPEVATILFEDKSEE